MNNINVLEHGYRFKNIYGLHCDKNGNFFFRNKPIKKRWRKGQIYIEANKKRYGINTLRKLAYKYFFEKDFLPF